MSELFADNLSIIRKRWPNLAELLKRQNTDKLQAFMMSGAEQTLHVNGIQLTSRYARKKEARLQAEEIPVGSSHATLFGTGLGDVPRELLKRKELKLLNVVIMNETVFSLVLQYSDQQDWLKDERLNLVPGSFCDIKKMPSPYFALWADVTLAADGSGEIRNELLSKNMDKAAAESHSGDNARVLTRLSENIEFIKSDPQAEKLFDSAKGRQAFVLGAGPSLEGYYEHLKQLQKNDEPPLIVSVDTALKGLLEHGVMPDVVVSIDEKISSDHLCCGKVSDSVKLVYFPRIPHDTIKSWKGPRYLAYDFSGSYSSVRQEYPRTQLFCYGSVIHPAIDIAVRMGVSRVTLIGADFAYVNNKTHAGWGDGQLGASYSQSQFDVVNGLGKRVPSNRAFIAYLRGVEKYIKLAKVPFFNASIEGAKIAGTSIYNRADS